MFISINWIKDFVNLAGIDIKDLILNNIGSGILAQVKIQRKL